MTWTVEFLNATVEAELDELPSDIRASFLRISQAIKSGGFERVGMPLVRHLEGRLWEMRLKGRDGIARAIYVTAIGRRVIVIRIFRKKTRKTPRREIDLALKRIREGQQ